MDLIERGDVRNLLHAALAQARAGAGRTALVCGEAGIGKTSLARDLAAQAGRMRVLWGACEALFSPRPLGPLYDMADGIGSRLRSQLGREGQRAEMFAALLEELRARPTLMVFEDLHWADAATLDLVKYLARRVQSLPVLLVLTYRDNELDAQHALRQVLGDLPADACVRAPLRPLSAAAVAELARQCGRSPEGVHAATGGNPFFVTEALRAEGLPVTVRDAVLARLARQAPAVRDLLELAAIVPARIECSVVDALLAPGREVLAGALASGLLEADGRSYQYRHELARMAVKESLAAPRAHALHARLLQFLENLRDGNVTPARLVHHADGAADAAAVLRLAPQAAAQAASHGAHREAAALYGIALSHASGIAAAERGRLLEQRAYQCYLTDQIEDAIAARSAALAIWRSLGDRLQEGRTLRWLSRLHWFIGRNREAQAHAMQAVDLLEKLAPGAELAWALSNRAQLYMLAGHAEAAIAWGERAVTLATQLAEPEVLAHALNNVGTARYAGGDLAGHALLQRSLALSLEGGYAEHVARAYANLASTAVCRRDYAAAQQVMDEAATYVAARDLDAWAHYVLAYQARLHLERGQLDAGADVAARLLGKNVIATVARIPALAVLARIRLRRNDPGARALLSEALTLALETGELQRLAPVVAAQAEADWLQGEDTGSADLLARTLAMAASNGDARAWGELAYWCGRLGVPVATPGPQEHAYAQQATGRWQAAADAWLRLGCPYERALALLEGDEPAMRAAVDAFDAMGAGATARRAREHLRARGVRGVARGPRATTAANPAGLTARELQVLRLLTRGLTNAQIAGTLVRSEKTVDHHISSILRKLAVRSRGEAAVAASRLGLAGPQ